MSNPALNRSIFAPTTSKRYGTPVGFDQPTTAPTPDAATLDAAYQAGTASSYHTGRLTYDDVIIKTAGLLALVVAGGALGWVVPALFLPGVIVGLVLGLVNAFKREPNPALMMLYAIFEGMALGGISAYFNETAHGVVLQAVVATVATFVAVLVLFSSGKVRATPKMTRFVLVAMGGYFLFSLINMVLVWTGALPDFGLRSVTVMGIPLGLVVSILAVLLGTYSLIIDFDMIKRGVEAGIPRRYAWTGAYGLTVTLVWLYLEFLRILAYLQRN